MDTAEILVVDDNEQTRALMKFALTKAGYTVSEAETGKVALDHLENNKPALIILDIVMPDMDGYTFMRNIKSIPLLKNIPIIVSSGKSGIADYFNLDDEKYRPAAFLEKPFKVNDLITAVKEII
jgi:CheY-like chemotaxis protein